MKATIINRFNAALLLIAALFISVTGYAEGKGLNVNITKTTESSSFMASPWVWIVGAAVFVLLLAAILNGGRRRSDD